MSKLVIVESPTKAKTLSRFLGSGYQIEATMGHIRDLPEKKLGVEIKDKKDSFEFLPQYQIISDRKPRVTELKKLAESASTVILATDPDREGEAIAWHISEILRYNDTKILGAKNKKNHLISQYPNIPISLKRIVFHEITESAIKHALESPRSIDMQLVDAQQARRILDRLVGYKLSPLLWNKLGKRWLSAGRVQSVAVRLIVEREREILAFKPEEYWIIDVELSQRPKTNDQRPTFLARLEKIDDKKADIKNKDEAEKIVSELKSTSYKIANIEIKDQKRYPAPPFITSTLQQAASNRFGWTAKRTMRAAQNLYEEGLITYHRTDSTNLASAALNMVRDYINNVYGQAYLPEQAKFYKTRSKVAQEAHEAIRPTEPKILGYQDIRILGEEKLAKNNLKKLDETLGRDADILYSLIWKRFVASQMNEAIIEQTNVDIQAMDKKYLLGSQGERMKFDGWTILYGKEKDKELPVLTIGEILNLINILPQQKFTEPPGRFTEATLIKALEEQGIGRPSTYAPIISTIQDRKYVEKMERKFAPTDLGFAVNDFLIKYFPDVFDVGFTAKLEDELDEIANGNMEWNSVIGGFYAPFKVKLDEVFKEADRVKVDLGTTDEKCPKCGSALVFKLSKYGKFLACSKYPTCKFTKNVIEKAGIPCPRCGGDIVVKKTRRGKQFYGCINWPKCTFAAWKKEDIK